MEKMIAYCGLICTNCPAYIATQKNDLEALRKLAARWQEELNTPLTAEGCMCDGCLATTQVVVQTSSHCKTEAFTAENAEYAESGMGTLILHLSDLCALCGKMLETRV